MGRRLVFCYLIHFDKPYHHARHYVGSTVDVPKRLARHRRSDGANLLRVLNKAGIGYRVVRVWLDGGEREQILKRVGHNARYCPICRRNSHG